MSHLNSAEFSPDGTRIVTAAVDGTAHIWDAIAPSRRSVSWLDTENTLCSPLCLALTACASVTASTDKTARIWHVPTVKEIAILRGHEQMLNSAEFSPDGGHIVTASQDGTARIWDAAGGTAIAVLDGHMGGRIASAVFSPNGTRIVTASWDRSARIWETATGKQIAVLRGHEDRVTSAAFSPDGTRIVAHGV